MKKKSPTTFIKFFNSIIISAFGSFLAAIAIRVFLYPNDLIDGGVVGVSLICSRIFGSAYMSLFLIVLNIPFIFLAYKHIRKTFVIHMLIALSFFAIFLSLLQNVKPFDGDFLEIIVIGGAILGSGIGFIIKSGGCTDGTEILAIIINRQYGFTVGQIILMINIFIFAIYGWIFHDWHIALKSLMTYIVAFKMIDIVIAGLDELKSVLIITSKPKKVQNLLTHELGLGLTVIPGIGGFSGENKEILFLIVERLDIAELKNLVLIEDPFAIIAIENLHEVAYGKSFSKISRRKFRLNYKRKKRLSK
jgi:uncharacterized membrane-anchored protein YitT (DUF2179 family)